MARSRLGTSIQLDEHRISQNSPEQANRPPSDDMSYEANFGTEGDAGQNLPPADGGYAAWKLLCTAFVFEALLWGFPLSFGVFQDYYSQQPEFANNRYISVVGTIASGISYLGAPFVTPFIKRYSRYQRQMIWVGWPVCILALVAGSFAKTLGGLIFTQGILYGMGFLIFYYPILAMVNEFWIARRGMAYGLLCSSSGVSGVVMPFILQALLKKYGYPTTLRAIALALLVLTGPLIPLLKGRLPHPTEQNATVPKTDWSVFRRPVFWAYTVSNIFQGLGYFFPSLYLPSYATSIGLSTLQGAFLLALMSVFQVIGQFSFGYLSDRRVSLDLLIVLSLLVSSTAALALWGLSRSLAPLILFAIIYGIFGAGYVAMWARMVTAVTDEPTAALTTFSTFCFGKGVGNVLAGPISAAMLSPMTDKAIYGAMRYKGIVAFTGACMLLSAMIIGVKHLRPKI